MANIIGKFATNETLEGTSQADLIVGSTGSDVLKGLAGDDTLFASINNDTLEGGDGNDLLFGNAGADSLDGGTGSDSLKGGAGNDTVLGNDGNDTLVAGAGNDSLNGGAGNDTFVIFGKGNNTIDGGVGTNDVVDYSELRRAVTLGNQGLVDKGVNGTDTIANIEKIIAPILNPNLTSNLNTIDGSGADTIPGSFTVDLANNSLTINGLSTGAASFVVENFDAVIGTPNGDSIAGDAANNSFNGGGGNDTIIGSLGNDTIEGGAGNDVLDYSSLGEIITLQNLGVIQKGALNTSGVGAAGTDQLQSTNGIDIVETIIAPSGLTNTIDGTGSNGDASFNVNLTTGQFDINVGGTTATTFNFIAQNFVNVIGTEGSDTIAGSAADNSLNGGGGNDTIIGSMGNDAIDGGTGTDTVDYSALGVAVTLLNQGIIDKGGMAADTIGDAAGNQTIERIVGALGQNNAIDGTGDNGTATFDIDLTNNSLTVNNINGNSLNFTVENFNTVTGTGNNDTIQGSASSDTILGAAGDDSIIGSGGSDSIDGGTGTNTLDYTGLGSGIILQNQGVIAKTGGVDTIGGAMMEQTIQTIIGDAGQTNAIDGTGSAPTASFNVDLSATTNNLVINAGTAGIITFTAQNFVNVTGTEGNDTIAGSAANNALIGGAGDDSIIGSAGSDTIDGGAGINTVDYSALGQLITLQNLGVIDKGALGADTIGDAAGTGTQTIQTIIGATGLNNAIDGTGDNGAVTFSVNLETETLTLNGGTVTGAAFTVQNFVDVTGTSGSDSIVGSAANNTFIGTLGNDTIAGGAGADTLDYSGLGQVITLQNAGLIQKGVIDMMTGVGASGSDSLQSANGIDIVETIIAPSGLTNTIDGSGSNPDASFNVNLETGQFDVSVGGLTATTFNFTAQNFVNVIGTAGDDTIIGSSTDNIFTGSAGSDIIDGFGGTNTLDYTGLGGAIALLNQGIISKQIGGIDTIGGAGGTQTIQTIIGDTGNLTNNIIDGSGSNATASFNVDLGATTNNLVIGTGSSTLTFTALNFDDVIGTAGNDTITGNANDNFFGGSAGNDLIDGVAGINTLDYTDLGAGITLQNFGIIDKGVLGADTIGGAGGAQTIQTIVGDATQTNSIDGTGDNGAVTFTVDLSTDTLTLNGLSAGAATFTVTNFDNVTGTSGNDMITGSATSNILNGFDGADMITGGTGADTFVLGDGTSVFYSNNGAADFATITDFTPTQNDVIQLTGANTDYSFVANGTSTDILLLGTSSFSSTGVDDLIATVQNTAPTILDPITNPALFSFV